MNLKQAAQKKKGLFKMRYKLYKQIAPLPHIWRWRIQRKLQNQPFHSFISRKPTRPTWIFVSLSCVPAVRSLKFSRTERRSLIPVNDAYYLCHRSVCASCLAFVSVWSFCRRVGRGTHDTVWETSAAAPGGAVTQGRPLPGASVKT